MKKNLYDELYLPDIQSQNREILETFREMIGTGLEVFAKENNMNINDATQLFQTKLNNIPIRIFDERTLKQDYPEIEERLSLKLGVTDLVFDPNNSEKPVQKAIYLNSCLLGDKEELKSTFMHEMYHLVLSDDKLNFRNGQYVYNLGCHETCFENGNVVNNVGRQLHEGLVARMQKKFCQKEGIKFQEKGLFASGYTNEIKIIDKFEKISGRKISPNKKLASLKFDCKEIEEIAKLLDNSEYDKCEEVLKEYKDKKIEQTYGSGIANLVRNIRNVKDNVVLGISNIFNKNKEVKMLEAPKNISDTEDNIPKVKTASQKFAESLKCENLKTLPNNVYKNYNNNKSVQKSTDYRDFD